MGKEPFLQFLLTNVIRLFLSSIRNAQKLLEQYNDQLNHLLMFLISLVSLKAVSQMLHKYRAHIIFNE